jgi:hypothetical protein
MCWQSTTLNRGDELVNLPLAFLQPHAIRVAESNYLHGRPVGMTREIFGILSMFWDTKTANADVCVAICEIGAPASAHSQYEPTTQAWRVGALDTPVFLAAGS